MNPVALAPRAEPYRAEGDARSGRYADQPAGRTRVTIGGEGDGNRFRSTTARTLRFLVQVRDGRSETLSPR
jgi:hypothetical protein